MVDDKNINRILVTVTKLSETMKFFKVFRADGGQNNAVVGILAS